MLGTGWRASVADATGKNRDCGRAFVNERESLERREKLVEAVRGVVEGALLCGACKGQYGYLVWTTEIHTSHALTKSPHAALPKGDEAKADCGNDDGEVRNAA